MRHPNRRATETEQSHYLIVRQLKIFTALFVWQSLQWNLNIIEEQAFGRYR